MSAAEERTGPASFLTLQTGTTVVDRFGVPVGPVERVLIAGDYFDGIIVGTPAGRRFVDAPEVRRIDTARVRLSIARADVEHPGVPRVLGAHTARSGRTDASEADRRAVIDGLKYAYVHDRLTTDDLAHRVEAAYTATTLDELEAILPK